MYGSVSDLPAWLPRNFYCHVKLKNLKPNRCLIKNLRKAKTESDRRGDTCAKRDQETQRDKGTETDRGRETGGSPTHAPAEE